MIKQETLLSYIEINPANLNYNETKELMAKYPECVNDRNPIIGKTALIYMSAWGHLELVQALIESGADVNLPADKEEMTSPLIEACSSGYWEEANLLIKNGANVNYQNKDRQTALMEAVRRKHSEICELLIENGANIDLKDIENNTAIDYLYKYVVPPSIEQKQKITAIFQKAKLEKHIINLDTSQIFSI